MNWNYKHYQSSWGSAEEPSYPVKKRYPRNIGPETCEQIAVFDWMRATGLDRIAWHTANERKISPQGGEILKRMGVKAGVSDICLMRASRGYHGLFIEMKSSKGRLTSHQKEFIEAMLQEGYFAKTSYSADDAIDTIKWYLQM